MINKLFIALIISNEANLWSAAEWARDRTKTLFHYKFRLIDKKISSFNEYNISRYGIFKEEIYNKKS